MVPDHLQNGFDARTLRAMRSLKPARLAQKKERPH
jgi:hypothetical protein